ncbi:MAG: 50S ribosomal protein L30 [Anaerolineae bacterium]|nr:50S ribosomal protein L30 [Anaerolineae bacterium]
MTEKLRVTLTKSPIGYPRHHKETVRSLGLRRMHQTVVLNNTPTIRGMVDSVRHLVSIEVYEDQE